MIGIADLARAERLAIRLHGRDNVAIVRAALPAGTTVRLDGRELVATVAIPAGHKISLTDIPAGAEVTRYGEPIGVASRTIHSGELVHTHNVSFVENNLDYEIALDMALQPVPPERIPEFLGFARSDGRAGTRNYIAIAAASNCAAHVVSLIARHFEGVALPGGLDGVVAFPHGEGCGHSIGPDTAQLRRTLSGVLDHPNVAGAVIVGLGCEVNYVENYFPPGIRETEQLAGITMQQSGGTTGALAAGIKAVELHIERAARMVRKSLPATRIVLGLNCGGSDSFSGVTANPALGACSDLFAQIGASAVLAETPEIFGAEHLLARRAVSREVANRLLDVVRGYRSYLRRFDGSFDDNPSPGNKDGGLTNIVEKSLGAVAKGGSSPLRSVVEYAERVTSPGLVYMNTPGYDPVSLTGLAAGGVNLIAFTTGRGSAIGFPTAPVIKIATNSAVFHSMRDNMDWNAGRILDGELTIEEAGREIFQLALEVASGRRTASERLGHAEFVPWRIGPVL